MKYIEVKLELAPYNEAISASVIAELGEIGFDSFSEEDSIVNAYIQKEDFDELKLKELIGSLPFEVSIKYEWAEMEDRNWNEEWEKNYFDPVVIDNKCVIKSSFHKDVPEYEYTIIINPKMAFGTGHHQTTILMLKEVLKMDFSNQSVLDMGCGTAILAIAASLKKAASVLAIDIDEWAYNNALENLELNNINNVEIKIGGAELLGDQMFDTIIANINRNILLEDIQYYTKVLNKGGALFMSGFYTEDIEAIESEARKHNLKLEYSAARDNWAGVKFVKQ